MVFVGLGSRSLIFWTSHPRVTSDVTPDGRLPITYNARLQLILSFAARLNRQGYRFRPAATPRQCSICTKSRRRQRQPPERSLLRDLG